MEWITTSTVLTSLRDFENHAAWDAFVSRFHDPIRRFAHSIGLVDADAEDVAQETLAAFAEGFRAGRYDRSKGRLSQWLFGIAYRKAQDERRRASIRPGSGSSEVALLAERATPTESDLSAIWDRQWEQSVLEQCLARVRREVEPATFEAFDLVVRQDLDAAAAAASLGLPIKSVYNAKHRVLRRIRELRHEFESIC